MIAIIPCKSCFGQPSVPSLFFSIKIVERKRKKQLCKRWHIVINLIYATWHKSEVPYTKVEVLTITLLFPDIYFRIRFGLLNSIHTYSRLNIRVRWGLSFSLKCLSMLCFVYEKKAFKTGFIIILISLDCQG